MKKYMISEFADLCNVAPSVLRYYDKKGILSPEYRDDNTGYRYYTEGQLSQLAAVEYLRSLGIGASKIKELVAEDDMETTHHALLLRSEEISAQLKELSYQRAALSSVLDGYCTLENHPECGVPFLKAIFERYLYVYETDVVIREPGFSDDYMRNLVAMMNEMQAKGVRNYGYINVGAIFDQEENGNRHLCTRLFSKVDPTCAHLSGVVQMPEFVAIGTLCDDPAKEDEYIEMLYKESERRRLNVKECTREQIVFYPRGRDGVQKEMYLLMVRVSIH